MPWNKSNYRQNLREAKKLQIPRFISFNRRSLAPTLQGHYGNYRLNGYVAFPLENGDALIRKVSGRITEQDENFVIIDGTEYFVNWYDVHYNCTDYGNENLFRCYLSPREGSSPREVKEILLPIRLF